MSMSSRSKILLWILGGAMLTVVGVCIVASILISKKSRGMLQDWMSRQYGGDVQLSDFHVAIPFPLVQVQADDVTLYFKGRRDLPPLIAIKQLTMRTAMWGLLRGSPHISFVHLEGLRITIPPREAQTAAGGDAKNTMRKFGIARFDEILTENATLTILTSKPGKSPLEFDLQQLRLNSYGSHRRPWHFTPRSSMPGHPDKLFPQECSVHGMPMSPARRRYPETSPLTMRTSGISRASPASCPRGAALRG